MRIAPLLLVSSALCAPLCLAQTPVKVGLIGLDTSHAVRFTELLNDPTTPGHVPGATVAAAYRGGSSVAKSRDRIDGYTREITGKYHVKLAPTIEDLCREVDAVMLLSVDGRQHLEQARLVFGARKPVFIDKPLAGSLKDAREIARLAAESGTAVFSASSLRYSPLFVDLKNDASVGAIQGALTYGPMEIETYIPDLFWYGIHSVEGLYVLMGPGCERVSRVHTDGADSVVGTWKDGRIGEIRGLRFGPSAYGAVVFGAKKVAASSNLAGARQSSAASYDGLLQEIVKFFHTSKPPVELSESLEVLAFMEAADRSKLQNGAATPLEPIR